MKRQTKSRAHTGKTKALKEEQTVEIVTFRLYVTGSTQRALKAITNIRKVCEQYLHGHYSLEVIDIFKRPGTAQANQIIAAPTLIKQTPLPPQRFIGDLSDTERLLHGLNIKPDPVPAK